jgi:hypothetical protein
MPVIIQVEYNLKTNAGQVQVCQARAAADSESWSPTTLATPRSGALHLHCIHDCFCSCSATLKFAGEVS